MTDDLQKEKKAGVSPKKFIETVQSPGSGYRFPSSSKKAASPSGNIFVLSVIEERRPELSVEHIPLDTEPFSVRVLFSRYPAMQPLTGRAFGSEDLR